MLAADRFPALSATVAIRLHWPPRLPLDASPHRLNREHQCYATLLLIAINQFSPRHRWDLARLRGFIEAVGIVLLAAGLQGYLLRFGAIGGGRLRSAVARSLLIAAGLAFALPGSAELGISHLVLLVAGACLVVPALLLNWAHRWPHPA